MSKARGLARGAPRILHSRPGFYGGYVALWTVLPALFVVVIWSAAAPIIIDRTVRAELPQEVLAQSDGEIALVMGTIRSIAQGLPVMTAAEKDTIRTDPKSAREILGKSGVVLAADPQPFMLDRAQHLNDAYSFSRLAMTGTAVVLVVVGFLYAFARVAATLRARNLVEGVTLAGLI